MQVKKYHENIKEEEIKRFGKSVSSTPLSILSKPKKVNNYESLSNKFIDDKLIKKLMSETQQKKARYPF
jgi:hypothetical protein